jgi:hypothetical protein
VIFSFSIRIRFRTRHAEEVALFFKYVCRKKTDLIESLGDLQMKVKLSRIAFFVSTYLLLPYRLHAGHRTS